MPLFLALLPYIAAVVGIVTSLALFLGTNRRIGKLIRSVAACEAALQAEAAQLTNAMNDLKRRLTECEKAEMQNVRDLQPAGDLTNAARSKVFKLHRAGQASNEIAQKLRLSKGEVELLIKAQRIVMRPYEEQELQGGAEKSLKLGREPAIQARAQLSTQ